MIDVNFSWTKWQTESNDCAYILDLDFGGAHMYDSIQFYIYTLWSERASERNL